MRTLALLVALCFPSAAVAASFLEYGDPRYEAVKTASDRVGESGWVAQRLRKNMPVTESMAKELAQFLKRKAGLPQQYKTELERHFPSETKPVDLRYDSLNRQIKDLDAKIADVQAKLDVFEAGMRNGLLSGRSRPSVLFALDAGMAYFEEWKGLGGPRGSRPRPGSGIWTEWTTAGDGYSLRFVLMFYDGYIDFTGGHLEFFFDNAFMPGIEVQVANEDNYPAISNLIFGGGGGPGDDFGKLNELSGRKDLVKSGPGYGARGGQDIYLRRKSSGDWWPFSDTQFVATQTYNYYWPGQRLSELAGSVKVRGLPLFWPLQRADPAFAFLWSSNDRSELNGFGEGSTPGANSSAQALALNSQLAGGGTLSFEIAAAEWQSGDYAKSYRDVAVQAILSKSIGTSAVVIDYQHTGPEYFPGTLGESAGNFSAFYHISATASGNEANFASYSGGPGNPSANSEHLAFGITKDYPVSSFGFTFGTNQQIKPTTYVLGSTHLIGFSRSRKEDSGEGSHGFTRWVPASAYNAKPKILFNAPTGPPELLNSSELLNPGALEVLYLTKNGVGDANLRPDSVKYINFMTFRGDLNVQSLLDAKRPFLIKFASTLINTDESVGLAQYTDKTLLMQIASSITINFELPWDLQFVTAVGYEDWVSRATYEPIEYHTTWAFLDINKTFPLIMTSFTLGPRFAYLRHRDPNNGFRDIDAWRASINTGTTF